MMIIGELLDPGCIAPRVAVADKRQALSVIAELAARSFGLKAPKVFDILLERESQGATGLGYGVAIPHAQIVGLDRMRGVFLRLEKPIDFGAVDDQPVDLLFALLAPKGQGSEHLRALARVSRVFRKAHLREQLRNAKSCDAIQALLTQDACPDAA
jgi:PTS system nitrogen regulatory IIA component